jgi:hypothetical protein
LAGVLAAGVDVEPDEPDESDEPDELEELELESLDDADVGEPFDSFPASLPDFLA